MGGGGGGGGGPPGGGGGGPGGGGPGGDGCGGGGGRGGGGPGDAGGGPFAIVLVGLVAAAFFGFVLYTLWNFSCWVAKHRNPFSYAGLLMEEDELQAAHTQDKQARGDLSQLQDSL